ncbi:TPA: hypothetical protein ACJ2XP_002089 [Enterobacter cloacae]|uniref:hypothetical protein n=1 Tax=Enterobacter hormaechei TaxID=158836 RepID=UPI00387C2FCC
MSIKNLVEMIKHNGLLASMAHLEKLYQVAIENEQKLAELESNLAALAAENALLKKSEPAPFSKLMMEALDVYQEGADEVPELAMLSAYKKLRDGLKTPATDAFLAEVRAAAVDEVCLKISNAIVNCYQDEQIGLDAAATICGDFASGLRKGVQS